MAVKVISVTGVGPVSFVKSARSRNIRLSVNANGVRVSLPRWTPYAVAVAFTGRHAQWIESELAKHTRSLLREGDKIGKLHTVHFESIPERSVPRTRVTPTKLIVMLKPSENSSDLSVQKRAEAAALRALKKEASVVLPPRIRTLADKHGLSYALVNVKNLKRRWGSCDSHGNITLSLFLMQLSWQQIDYVLCHELAHTKHMNHSAAFWTEMKRMMPDARMIAKRVRHIQPALTPTKTATAFDDDMTY
ncbi:M48 family metallopeptidase [Candidatus Saccharibacteria bacterium]|nr:MAG: M48 family metallopeptidase [Candidatus Saccharibacteria bacterium]